MNLVITGTTKHPFDTRKEEMKHNSPNMFGTYKTKRNRFRLNGKFLRNVDPTATLAKNVVLPE